MNLTATGLAAANPATGVSRPAGQATSARASTRVPFVAGDHAYVGDENSHLTKLPLTTSTAGSRLHPDLERERVLQRRLQQAAVGHGKVFVSTIAGFVCAFDRTPPVSGTDGIPRPELMWRARMPSKGWANGPVLAHDTLYAIGDNGDILALDRSTGAPRWTANVGGSDAQHPLLAAPTVLEGKLYVGIHDGRIMSVTPPTTGTTGTVRAVSLTTTGTTRWKQDTGHACTCSGRAQAPAVVDGIVCAPTKTHIFYLDRDTGTWTASADTSPNQPTTPAVMIGVAYTGGNASGGMTSGALQAFDAKIGALLDYLRTHTVANTSPAVAPDGKVLLGGGNGCQGGRVVLAYTPSAPQRTADRSSARPAAVVVGRVPVEILRRSRVSRHRRAVPVRPR
ncbi:hypothetical protein GCM10010492_30260 [Saccharothrix mutabilis subsp. mutabilis]|uniref:Pyrrolo-quinoline quinone repeat domain-containing protein n=1 Tax=Saccharothrix mutabilis subsp. mutabilis TaxID=66855 RepID=A0ABP3DDN7_9PSEU